MWGPILKDWAPVIGVVLTVINLGFLTLQITRQNRISKVQLLRDRFDMYKKVYRPVTDDELALLHLNPDDYIPGSVYAANKDDSGALKKYILMTDLVEFLAFTYELRYYGVHDSFGSDWVELWTKDLKTVPEFKIVKEHYKDYYPKFSKFADSL
jgi:hypothetical protein